MYTVKMDKRGKILIPKYYRKTKNLFANQKFDISTKGDSLIFTPYQYICKHCGESIPDGDKYGSCENCSKKHIRVVY